MGKLVVCGDSFSIGIGCHDLYNDPYGSLLAKKLNKELINFSKGSSTNLSIFLQVKYAVENIEDIDLLIVAPTCHYRIEWFSESSSDDLDLENYNVNYHEYPPYGELTYNYLLPNPMSGDTRYNGHILTENFHGIVNYVDTILNKKGKNDMVYYKKFKNENDEKFRLLKDYYLNFFDVRIQSNYDIGQIVMAHNILEKNNINHYILVPYIDQYIDFVRRDVLINVDWNELALRYPDDLNTLHTSYKGQKVVFDSIIKKMSLDG